MDQDHSLENRNGQAAGTNRTSSTPDLSDQNDLPMRSATERLERITRLNLSARQVASNRIPDDILPGIPASPWHATSSQSQPYSSESARHSNPSPRARPFIIRTNSNEEDVLARRSGSTRRKAWTRTLNDGTEETLSANPWLKGRSRIGSIHERAAEPLPISSRGNLSPLAIPVALPYVTPKVSPMAHSTRSRAAHDSSRNSPPNSETERRTKVPQPMVLPSLDKGRMLHLMSTTRGCMQGNLYFREGYLGAWFSSYCCVNSESGSLLCESSGKQKTLISNLRGCKVKASIDSELCITVLNIFVADSGIVIQLRPKNTFYFNAWFAALLCWQPVRPKQRLSPKPRRQHPAPLGRLPDADELNAPPSSDRARAVIKVGKLSFLDSSDGEGSPVSPAAVKTFSDQPRGLSPSRWTRVSCILRDRGELKINRASDNATVAAVQLSELPRSAVQRLSATVLNVDFCIAIYPQYAHSTDACSRLRPIILSVDSRVLYEVWYVLLRAFAIPDLYGPQLRQSSDSRRSSEILPGLSQGVKSPLFRIEQSLHVRISEVKFRRLSSLEKSQNDSGAPNERKVQFDRPGDYYVQILLDRQVKAKTSVRYGIVDPFWYESFEFPDLSTAVSSASIRLKRQPEPPSPPSDVRLSSPKSSRDVLNPGISRSLIKHAPNIGDITCGEVNIELYDIDPLKEVDKWWPMLDESGRAVGDILVRIRVEQEITLMDTEYESLSALLDNIDSTLTIQIAEKIPSELPRLSECLLNIFQVSGRAEEWIFSLAEEEIDGVLKETPVTRMRFTRRLESNESKESLTFYDTGGDREGLVRDLGRSATAEANLLFRGNTLLSKSLDIHMKRLGKEYLEDTLGEKIRDIYAQDPEVEVDPNKVSANYDLQNNWRRLIDLTKEIWECIYQSASKCPRQLRTIFRHIRACADDRYGDFLRSVPYSSVSGFLFLRFFCAAVLNPKLFGLLKDNSKPHAQRTFTLIAKSLQGLANMSTFGPKEPWMEPMNHFLTAHRQEFKNFIEVVCAVPTEHRFSIPPPSYSTPIAIFTRLPPASREGFPSLPYLLDTTRNYAALVNLWMDNYAASPVVGSTTSVTPIKPLSGDLLRFHQACVEIRQRTKEVLERADMSESKGSGMSQKWMAIAERMETAPDEFWMNESQWIEPAHAGTEIETRTGNPLVGPERRPGAASRPRPKAITSRPVTAEELELELGDAEFTAISTVGEQQMGESDVAQSPKTEDEAGTKVKEKGKEREKEKKIEKSKKRLFGRRK